MKLNPPKNLLLFLITLGSSILAIPGAFGSFWLIIFAIEAFTKFDSVVLLLPVALIGYFLLLGYFWTVWSKRFVKWFWLISMVFNLLITFVSEFFIVKMNYETINFAHKSDALLRLSFLLFPLWTLFVAVASAKYAFFSPTTEDLHLP